MSRPVPAERAARYAADLIMDCIATGHAAQWRKRAEVFDACRVRQGEFLGRDPQETPAERDRRLDAVIEACRNRAAVIELERAR